MIGALGSISGLFGGQDRRAAQSQSQQPQLFDLISRSAFGVGAGIVRKRYPRKGHFMETIHNEDSRKRLHRMSLKNQAIMRPIAGSIEIVEEVK